MIKYLERSGEEGVLALRHRIAPFVRGVFAGDLYGEMGEPAVRRPDLLRHAERRVGQCLRDLRFRDAVVFRRHQMVPERGVRQPLRHERRNRHDAAVAQRNL